MNEYSFCSTLLLLSELSALLLQFLVTAFA